MDPKDQYIIDLKAELFSQAQEIGLLRGQLAYAQLTNAMKDREIAALERKLAALECYHCFDPTHCDRQDESVKTPN